MRGLHSPEPGVLVKGKITPALWRSYLRVVLQTASPHYKHSYKLYHPSFVRRCKELHDMCARWRKVATLSEEVSVCGGATRMLGGDSDATRMRTHDARSPSVQGSRRHRALCAAVVLVPRPAGGGASPTAAAG